MFQFSLAQMVGNAVQIWATALVTAWNVVAAQPKLQLMLASGVALTLVSRWLSGRGRRLRYR